MTYVCEGLDCNTAGRCIHPRNCRLAEVATRPNATPRSVEGAKIVADLPDVGPWQFLQHGDQLYAASQMSGVYLVLEAKLKKLELVDGPPVTVKS